QRIVTLRCEDSSLSPTFAHFPIREMIVYAPMDNATQLLYEYRARGGTAIHYTAAMKNYYAGSGDSGDHRSVALFILDTVKMDTSRSAKGNEGHIERIYMSEPAPPSGTDVVHLAVKGSNSSWFGSLTRSDHLLGGKLDPDLVDGHVHIAEDVEGDYGVHDCGTGGPSSAAAT
ncbi:unnamed protein product, partial [Amoebophrya sp. A25]